MGIRLTTDICYLAGIMSKTRESERSMVGIYTTVDEFVENFVALALRLGIETRKITIEENETGVKHLYAHNSKLAKQTREIIEKQNTLFRYRNEFSSSYLAGMFDASGNILGGRPVINGITARDRVMLETLGVHTIGKRIVGSKEFVSLIKGKSVLLENKLLKRWREHAPAKAHSYTEGESQKL
ncbi:MAG: hypothetical protein KGH61_04345 [Candidatus Micrarchaeota archaeon]|nr:hypothetical protein [Candidatus Micrarchaeota archaeon]MDE1848148.1 hypothetical protein [Candidatus Micrarchaeota archaeon]MDE1864108.1 hypothetical protein [Candidatus Micrarchaeota archaeon]